MYADEEDDGECVLLNSPMATVLVPGTTALNVSEPKINYHSHVSETALLKKVQAKVQVKVQKCR